MPMAQYTVAHIDRICDRICQLAAEIARPTLPKVHEESVVADIVKLVQEVGEGVAWAYQQGKRDRAGDFGDQFAQPFVERKVQTVLKGLLLGHRDGHQLRRDLQNRIAVQVLQTFHILLQATPEDSMLFCSVTAGYNLNEIITAPYEFREFEELLFLWMTLIKDIAAMLSQQNIFLFYDDQAKKPFPIFSEAAKYYQHPVPQVRTHVQVMSLDVVSKFKTQDGVVRTEPLFTTLMQECRILSTHVCCLLREFWKMVDDFIVSGAIFDDMSEAMHKAQEGKPMLPGEKERHNKLECAKRDVRSALSMQNDIFLYVCDLFAVEIPELSQMVQEKLLRVGLLPVLLKSMLRNVGHTEINSTSKEVLSPGGAAFLLYDGLLTIRHSCPMAPTVVAKMLLESTVPEEVKHAALRDAPRTPSQYILNRQLYSRAQQSGAFEKSNPDEPPDEDLYAMPSVRLPDYFERDGDASRMSRKVSNGMLEAMVEILKSVIPEDPPRGMDTNPRNLKPTGMGLWFLGVLAILLQTVNQDHEFFIAADVVPRLGDALCAIIGTSWKTPWVIVDTALRCLRELAKAGDKPPGRCHTIMAQNIRTKLLVPCSEKLFEELQAARSGPRPPGGRENAQVAPVRDDDVKLEAWLHEFQEAWIGHAESKDKPASFAFPPGPNAGGQATSRQRQKELFFSKFPDPPDAPRDNQRYWRVILGARSIFPTRGLPNVMPGVDEVEAEELEKYRCGVPVHLGKIHRVRCFLLSPRQGQDAEPVFMLPTSATLVLVKPDKTEPFWAVPLIVEPLRLVRIISAGDNQPAPLEAIMPPGGNNEERSLKFQILSPSSPYLQTFLQPVLPTRAVGAPTPGTVAAAAAVAAQDRPIDDGMELGERRKQLVVHLSFGDSRRQRVAFKIFAQSRHSRTHVMTEFVEAFLAECRQPD